MTMRAIGSAIALWVAFHVPSLWVCAANEEGLHALPPFRVVDLNIGERQSLRLSDRLLRMVTRFQ